MHKITNNGNNKNIKIKGKKMYFIGIVSNNKSFEKIRKKILEKIKDINMNIININFQTIENIQNVKFETIVIDNNLEKLKNKINYLEKICINSKYVLLNTDVNLGIDIFDAKKINIITYGLNQKATVTVSSIKDTDISIYIQRNIKNIRNEIIEVEERNIKIKEKSKIKAYEILIIYMILRIYEYKIIEEIQEKPNKNE